MRDSRAGERVTLGESRTWRESSSATSRTRPGARGKRPASLQRLGRIFCLRRFRGGKSAHVSRSRRSCSRTGVNDSQIIVRGIRPQSKTAGKKAEGCSSSADLGAGRRVYSPRSRRWWNRAMKAYRSAGGHPAQAEKRKSRERKTEPKKSPSSKSRRNEAWKEGWGKRKTHQSPSLPTLHFLPPLPLPAPPKQPNSTPHPRRTKHPLDPLYARLQVGD